MIEIIKMIYENLIEYIEIIRNITLNNKFIRNWFSSINNQILIKKNQNYIKLWEIFISLTSPWISIWSLC